MKFEITHRKVWNKLDKEKVTVHYIQHNESPRFLAIIHYDDKLTFWIKNIEQCTKEQMSGIIKDAHEFLSSSEEVQNLSIDYFVVDGKIEF